MLSDSLAGSVEAVGADEAHGEEVIGRAETAGGEVALGIGKWVSIFTVFDLAMEIGCRLTLYCTGS